MTKERYCVNFLYKPLLLSMQDLSQALDNYVKNCQAFFSSKKKKKKF